ncbi:MAG TPA: shikimate dehydrogenase, partial [Ignavibacteriales bacterium]|nr:shikimate dehydrogenase [Ignavibacteriales bacterium]
VKGLAALGARGFNITIPHKENVFPFLDSVSKEAEMIGAVNTVVIDNGKLIGYNTDVYGVISSIHPFKDKLKNAEACILGAGGASRSAVYALITQTKPSKINIINRDAKRAELLAEYFSMKTGYNNFSIHALEPSKNVPIIKNSRILINTTPVGMFPNVNDTPMSLSGAFAPEQIVFDMVYNPIRTKFLKTAELVGAQTINGLNMFVNQGAKAYELWTGTQMPVEKVFNALKIYLEN